MGDDEVSEVVPNVRKDCSKKNSSLKKQIRNNIQKLCYDALYTIILYSSQGSSYSVANVLRAFFGSDSTENGSVSDDNEYIVSKCQTFFKICQDCIESKYFNVAAAIMPIIEAIISHVNIGTTKSGRSRAKSSLACITKWAWSLCSIDEDSVNMKGAFAAQVLKCYSFAYVRMVQIEAELNMKMPNFLRPYLEAAMDLFEYGDTYSEDVSEENDDTDVKLQIVGPKTVDAIARVVH